MIDPEALQKTERLIRMRIKRSGVGGMPSDRLLLEVIAEYRLTCADLETTTRQRDYMAAALDATADLVADDGIASPFIIRRAKEAAMTMPALLREQAC